MAPIPIVDSDFAIWTASIAALGCFAVIIAVVVGCACCGKQKKETKAEDQHTGSLSLGEVEMGGGEKMKLYYVNVKSIEDALVSFDAPVGKIDYITTVTADSIEPHSVPIRSPSVPSFRASGSKVSKVGTVKCISGQNRTAEGLKQPVVA